MMGEEGWEISEWMMGAEESEWSERRTRALYKYIFWLLGDPQKTGGFEVEKNSTK